MLVSSSFGRSIDPCMEYSTWNNALIDSIKEMYNFIDVSNLP